MPAPKIQTKKRVSAKRRRIRPGTKVYSVAFTVKAEHGRVWDWGENFPGWLSINELYSRVREMGKQLCDRDGAGLKDTEIRSVKLRK
jgi:hypothetical protein